MSAGQQGIDRFQYVRIWKVAEVDKPFRKAGDWNSYKLGAMNPGVSLPINYRMCGWLVNPLEIGEVVVLLRCSRNGLHMPGIFMSTGVTAIPGPGEFHTLNSRYVWEELKPESPGDSADGNAAK